jgi:multicomponent Na+:H+ antiporter subunit E
VRSLASVVALAAIWVLLWGTASPANVLSGLLIGGVLVFAIPGLRPRGGGRYRLRPVAFARLAGHQLAVTVRANAELTREVLAPTRLRPGVVAVPLPDCSDEVLTLITNLLALSPGTMPIELDLDSDPTVLYIHVLRLTDDEQVRRDVLHLTDLTLRAFGVPS